MPHHDPPAAPALAWAAARVHPSARVVRVTSLLGGITAAMDRLTVATPAGGAEVVLRRWPDASWADGLVEREAAGLEAIAGGGVPAPSLIAADPDGSAAGVRATLTTALDGEPDLAPSDPASWIVQLAAAQAAIHSVPSLPPTGWDGWYDEGADPPDRYGIRHRPLAWIADPGLREAARAAAALPRGVERVLVHGDYQPFNVLWRGGRLSGVVDWPNAATGLRGSDVGHLRLNLAVLRSADEAAGYLTAYERSSGVPVDRVADLRALLCFDRDWVRFIPRQVVGRAAVDLPGMTGRVARVVREAVDALG